MHQTNLGKEDDADAVKQMLESFDNEYHSYKELCDDLDIDYGEFMRVKLANPKLSQMDLLSHFFERVLIKMTDSSYLVSKDSKK